MVLTPSKSHWRTVDYLDGMVPGTLVMRLAGKEYKSLLRSAQTQTGKEIEFLKDAKL